MDLPQQQNRVNAIGLLKSKDIEFTEMTFKNSTTPTEVVRGNIELEFVSGKKVNNVRIDVFSSRYSSKGKELPSYLSAHKLLELPSIDDNGKDEAARIVVSGDVNLNTYHDKEGQFHKNYRLNGNFFRKIDRDDDKYTDGVDARMTLTILGYKEETDRDQEPTGNYKVSAVNIGYGNRVNQIPNLLLKESVFGDDIEAIMDIYQPGTTGYFEIQFNNYVEVQKSEAQSHGFGRKLPSVSNRYVRDESIVYVSQEPYDEDESEEVLSPAQIKAAKKALKDLETEDSKPKTSKPKGKGFGKANKNPMEDPIEIDDEMVPF